MRLTTIRDLQDPANKALILDPKYDISKLLEDYLSTPEEQDNRAPGVHASELCTCKRQVVYSIYATKKVKTTPVEMRKRFMIGHAIHSMLQSEFAIATRKRGGTITFEDEVKTHDTELGRKYHITSSCDGIFTFYRPAGEDQTLEAFLRIGLEIKSEAPDAYSTLKAPRPKHIEQTTIYQACLDLPYIWFLYWNKGNQNYTPMQAPWLVAFQEKIWEKLEKRTLEVLAAADAAQLPDREEGYHCGWCPYSYTCKPPTQQSFKGQARELKPLTSNRFRR